jgi:thiol:disulfide interchange protein DsbD
MTASPAQDETSRIAALFHGKSTVLVLASFVGFGLLLSLTPCVLPMVPILSGIIVNHGHAVTHLRAFVLSCSYVLGMAVTYAAVGVAAGMSGTLLTSAFQNVWVLSTFGMVFVVLSFSMFGFYELQLPSALQSRLSESANHQGGSLGAIAVMGALSALIVGPCVAAPLAGALLYIAKPVMQCWAVQPCSQWRWAWVCRCCWSAPFHAACYPKPARGWTA